MKTKRVIARLDVKNNSLVKGIHLEGLRVLGEPSSYAKEYYKQQVDELMYMDVVASLYGRNGLLDVVSETAKHVFIPMTVGGGIRTEADVTAMLQSGADKVCINTAAVNNPSIISKFAEKFGVSTISVAIEAIKGTDGVYQAYTDNGREFTGKEVVSWAKQVVSLGAGELIITSVDNEGTGKGCDIELINSIANAVSVPVVAHGGVGSPQDVINVFNNTNADAVCAASVFHYAAKDKMQHAVDSIHGNTTFLQSNKNKKNIQSFEVPELKDALLSNDILVRM